MALENLKKKLFFPPFIKEKRDQLRELILFNGQFKFIKSQTFDEDATGNIECMMV